VVVLCCTYQNDNLNLHSQNQELATENDILRNKVGNLETRVNKLESDVLELEKIVIPGKIAASCQELHDRGVRESGSYQIRPTIDIEPFYVHCDFRMVV